MIFKDFKIKMILRIQDEKKKEFKMKKRNISIIL